MTSQPSPLLPSGSEMSDLIRQYDWTSTPIGSLDNWPISLRTLMRMMLTSRFPMLIFWGPELITFYNDAFRPSLGNNGKHPSSLGQPGHISWAESWPVIGPMIHDIMHGGEAVWFEDQKLPIYRDGAMGYAYWTYSFSPLTDDAGSVNGVLVTCAETTKTVESLQRVAASEAFARTLIDNSPVASLVLMGADMVISSVNTSMLAMLGRDTSVMGQPFMEAMPELQQTPLLERLRRVLTTGEPFNQPEERIDLIRYGQPYTGYYNYIYTALNDAAGQPTGVVVTAIEVTEQVLARQKIEASQQQLLRLFEQSPVGIAIIDNSLTFRMANPFYGMLVGRPPEMLIGKPLMEALPELDGQGFDALLKEVIATGQPFIATEVAVKLMRHQQMETIYVDLAYQPRRQDDGPIIGVLVVATDVTQQVLSRQALQVSESRLRSLVDSAPFPIGVYVGERMYIELANRSIMDVWGKGYDVVGKSYQDILPELASQPIFAQVDAVRRTGVAFHARHQQVDIVIDGRLQPFYFNYSFTPLLDENGQVYGVMNTAAEVTDLVLTQQALAASETRYRTLSAHLEEEVQQRTEELAAINEELTTAGEELTRVNTGLEESNWNLRRSNENLQQFAYIASHDLQEPLRKIQQFGDLLKGQYGPQLGDGVTHLDRMQAAAQRMSLLIRDLLAFSRISTGQAPRTSVSLPLIVDEALENLSLVIAETEAQIQVDPLPTVQGDVTQLGQLFLNLLSNAIKFSRQDTSGAKTIPSIQINCRKVLARELPTSAIPSQQTAAYYCIEVSDNGIGFDQKYSDRIFQVFQRLHSKNEFAGTGVGLAIVQKVVANHGGTVTASSQPGQGATFSIYLPA